MKMFKSNSEQRLSETIKTLRDKAIIWHAQIYHFSSFANHTVADDSTDILLGYIIEQFADKDGFCFVCADKDVIIICQTPLKKNFDVIAQKLAGHIPDDVVKQSLQPLSSIIDLGTGWHKIMEIAAKKLAVFDTFKKSRSDLEKSSKDIPSIIKENRQKLFAKGAGERKERQKPCVLLIEDDPLSMHLAKRALEKNFTIATATNAEDARAAYISNVPDIVFLDIGLPDANGHTLLDEFNTLDQEAFVVMLSGNSFHADIVKAMRKGAKGFIGKPFSRAKLLQYVAQSPHCAGSEAVLNLH